MSDVILERIRRVLGNLVMTFNISTQTYIDEDDPWTVILSAAVFAIISTNKKQKFYCPYQLIFGLDMVLLIKHRVDW